MRCTRLLRLLLVAVCVLKTALCLGSATTRSSTIPAGARRVAYQAVTRRQSRSSRQERSSASKFEHTVAPAATASSDGVSGASLSFLEQDCAIGAAAQSNRRGQRNGGTVYRFQRVDSVAATVGGFNLSVGFPIGGGSHGPIFKFATTLQKQQMQAATLQCHGSIVQQQKCEQLRREVSLLHVATSSLSHRVEDEHAPFECQHVPLPFHGVVLLEQSNSVNLEAPTFRVRNISCATAAVANDGVAISQHHSDMCAPTTWVHVVPSPVIPSAVARAAVDSCLQFIRNRAVHSNNDAVQRTWLPRPNLAGELLCDLAVHWLQAQRKSRGGAFDREYFSAVLMLAHYYQHTGREWRRHHAQHGSTLASTSPDASSTVAALLLRDLLLQHCEFSDVIQHCIGVGQLADAEAPCELSFFGEVPSQLLWIATHLFAVAVDAQAAPAAWLDSLQKLKKLALISALAHPRFRTFREASDPNNQASFREMLEMALHDATGDWNRTVSLLWRSFSAAPDKRFIDAHRLLKTLSGADMSATQIPLGLARFDELHDQVLDIHDIYAAVTASYERSIRPEKNLYTGFKIPAASSAKAESPTSQGTAGSAVAPTSSWVPTRLTHIPSQEEFLYYSARREPFIISIPDDGSRTPLATEEANRTLFRCAPLCHAFNWTNACCSRLTAVSELCKRSSAMPSVALAASRIGTSRLNEGGAATTSQGTTARVEMPFCDFLKWLTRPNIADAGAESGPQYFFDSASTKSFGPLVDGQRNPYDFPLSLLVDDIPPPLFLNGSLDSANLWLGNSPADRPGNSGLHYDKLDNFHFLLNGQKTWSIFSPADAMNMSVFKVAEPTSFTF